MTKKKNAGTPLLPHSLHQRHTFCDLIICKLPQKQVKNRSKTTSTCSPKQFHKGSRAPFCSCRSVANFFTFAQNFLRLAKNQTLKPGKKCFFRRRKNRLTRKCGKYYSTRMTSYRQFVDRQTDRITFCLTDFVF